MKLCRDPFSSSDQSILPLAKQGLSNVCCISWISTDQGHLRQRCGKICFDQTCVEWAVSSTCILRNVEHFSGEPSAWTVRERKKRKRLLIFIESRICLWSKVCIIYSIYSSLQCQPLWRFSLSGLFIRILQPDMGNVINSWIIFEFIQFLKFERKIITRLSLFVKKICKILMSFSLTITPLISTVRVEQEKPTTLKFSVSLMCVTSTNFHINIQVK